MSDETAVADILRPILGSYAETDSALVSRLSALVNAWRKTHFPIRDLSAKAEDILFNFCYTAFGTSMRLPLADGGSRRIMLSDLKDLTEEIISLPLSELRPTLSNYEMIYSSYMETASTACLRLLAGKFSAFLSEPEHRLILSIIKENDPDFAAQLADNSRSDTGNEQANRTEGASQ